MPAATESQAADIRRLCERVLAENWRQGLRADDGVPFSYTCPNAAHYPWQWYWDSCFTAITWRRFDRDRSRLELSSLLNAADDDGFIGHTIFWNEPLSGLRRISYNVTSRHPRMTATIQPPALAWAWRIAVGDPRAEPRIAAHHDWLERHRDLDGDGLIWILQPDESGLDSSPQFDPVWRWRSHPQPGFLTLVHRNRRRGFDLGRVAAAGGPVCCEVATNVIYCLSRLALGRPSITPVIVERMYDERTGLFAPLVRPRPAGPVPVTWAALAPLALPDLPVHIGRRLAEILFDPQRFWLPGGLPSVPADEPSFQRDDRGARRHPRYWRGPMWVNAAWLVWLGLQRLGCHEQADELAARTLRSVARSGLREYYDPYDGSGQGQRNFAWSTLILEMIEPDPRAGSSYQPQSSPAGGSAR